MSNKPAVNLQIKNSSSDKFFNDEPTSVFKPGDFWSSGCRFLFKRHKERTPKLALPVVAMEGYAQQCPSPDLRFATTA
jgi:hypothetical protein